MNRKKAGESIDNAARLMKAQYDKMQKSTNGKLANTTGPIRVTHDFGNDRYQIVTIKNEVIKGTWLYTH